MIADRDTGLPVGPPIDDAPAKRPARLVLDGRYVRLEPLDPAAHGDALFEATSGAPNDRLWVYLRDGPYRDRVPFDVKLAWKAASDDPLFFAIVDTTTKRAVGHVALMRIDSANRVIEVGNVLYTAALQRTRGATDAMYLLARHVFEDLGYERYEWKCDALNAASRRAALRLGFSFEGIFRHHMIVKGRSRDTAWYSMLAGEWPARKAAFERWLSPANFDAAGQQLSALTAPAHS